MQKEAADDLELSLKKRARRRLVGAIALVLLMIIVLPLILKGRAAADSQEKITITLSGEPAPADTSGFDSSIVPTEQAQVELPVPSPMPLADKTQQEEVATDSTTEATSDTETAPEMTKEAMPKEALQTNDALTTPKTAPIAAEEKTKETQEIKETVKPKEAAKPKEDVKTKETVKDKETVKAKEAVKLKTDDAQKFHVQVGVFSDPANVKQLQAKLSGLGYQSKTEKIITDKGQKIRLKTQVFDNRNEAAIALQNIKDAGLTGMVVSQ